MGPPTGDEPLPNIASPTTAAGIEETSVLRLVAAGERDGETRARASTVVLALDPEWEHAEQAIAGLEHQAAAHPELMFYVVSFWDTQQHFGLPQLLGSLNYILSSADAEGFAARDPIVGKNTTIPIQPTQWNAVVGHALSSRGGVVGAMWTPPARHAQRLPQPGRSLGATLLGLRRTATKSSPSLSKPRPARPRLTATQALRASIPYQRFANVRLHRRST